MRRVATVFVLTLTMCAASLLPEEAEAVERVYCDNEDVPCDCSEYPESMTCVEFEMENVVDVTDPEAVNEAYEIQTTYDEETEDYHVYADNTTATTFVLPTHPNEGHWESLD